VTTAELFAQAMGRHQAGDLQQAEQMCRLVLLHEPEHAGALHLLGVLTHPKGLDRLALDFLNQALALEPGNPLFRYDLGNILFRMGNIPGAVGCYRAATRLQPGHAEAHNNMGVALFELGQLSQAVASYQRALVARPEYPEALNNLGNALKELGHVDEAVQCFEQALRLRPAFADAHGNLANALTVRGQVPEALASYRRALDLRPDLALVRGNYLLCLNYDPSADAASVFEEHRRFGQLHGQSPPHLPVHANHRDPDRRLRIGYLADNFEVTAFACFLQPVLGAHDPARADVVCYQKPPVPQALAKSVGRNVSWRSLEGRTPAQVAGLVRADGIDILVDLLGHTRGNWLAVLPHRPAPVQATWLGYVNTTGLTCVDYRLTDAVADPPGEPSWHTELLWRLPGPFCCFGPPHGAPAVAGLPAARTGRWTFGSHHTLAKLNPSVLDLWCRVLRAVPGSRLLVFRDTLKGSASQRLLPQFADRGIDNDRVILRQAAAGGYGHLGLYHEIDVILDAFPWTGHTTTCDALWMGVPVLTLCGTRHAARMAASMLDAVGLSEFIAETTDAFVARAAQLVVDIDRVGQLRATLRQRMAASPLCDAQAFTRGLEEAYREMWRLCCARVG
jgi:protein O-GlcNAc transferase